MGAWLDTLADLVLQASPTKQVLLVFLGGLLTSANPCVLVAAPLVVGFTGGTEEGRHHPWVLSSVFCLGLAMSFTTLGLIAAMTGTLLGSIGWGWKLLLAVVLLGISLHLLGLIHLPMPKHDLKRFHGTGLLGAFCLGGLTGTLSAPCATPALAGILTLVAIQKQVVWGGVLLFVYAIGHVLLLFLAGVSSGWATRYLESHTSRILGTWIPRVMAILLLGFSGWVFFLAWQGWRG